MSINLNKKDRKKFMKAFYEINKDSSVFSKTLLIKKQKTKSKTIRFKVTKEELYYKILSKQFYIYGDIFDAPAPNIELTVDSIIEIPLESKLKAITTVGTLKAIRKSEIENETYQ